MGLTGPTQGATKMEWTEQLVTDLKRLWIEGRNASQVANWLGDISRSAVIGKIHRLGLAGREAPSRPGSLGGRPLSAVGTGLRASSGGAIVARRSPPPRPTLAPAPAADMIPSATILTLGENGCRWPIGDPGQDGFGFCGRLKGDHRSYCQHHVGLAFRPKPGKAASVRLERSFELMCI